MERLKELIRGSSMFCFINEFLLFFPKISVEMEYFCVSASEVKFCTKKRSVSESTSFQPSRVSEQKRETKEFAVVDFDEKEFESELDDDLEI